jgi:mitogen-activated protein kinase 15
MEADLCVALKNSVLKEIHKHYIFYQLANTLAYLHTAELVHRDIKPSNILVNETCEVKLCDFGLIRSLRKENQNDELVLTENIATRWYRAPEILLCSTNYGKAIDVWSMGCVLAEMVMQRPIFQGSSTISQLEKIFEVTGKPTAGDLDYLKNKSSINVIENMDIKERKSIRDLLNTNDKHIVDLLERIFQVDPRKRPTALEVLNHPFVSKFRGKVEEKLPEAPITILYEIKQIAIEDYKKLIFGEVDDKDFKVSEPTPNLEAMIYKTLPNDLGRKNVIANYPWGNLEKKSPLHSSNLAQKNFSPFASRQKREEKGDEVSQ